MNNPAGKILFGIFAVILIGVLLNAIIKMRREHLEGEWGADGDEE